jgi:AcrR family transcriptional regulator
MRNIVYRSLWEDVSMPPEEELLWREPDVRDPARRPLSRARIVVAAVAIADAEGLDAVSMPRLARTLATAPMSLYRHVPHKDALVDLMLDAAIGPPPVAPDASGRWRDQLAEWARANLQVFRLHPWTLPLVSGARRMGPNECAWGESALRVIVNAGIAASTQGWVLQLVNAYVRGAAVPVADRAPDLDVIERAGRGGELPLLVALLREPPAASSDADAVFEFGLARVLDGVEADLGRRAARTNGRGPAESP